MTPTVFTALLISFGAASDYDAELSTLQMEDVGCEQKNKESSDGLNLMTSMLMREINEFGMGKNQFNKCYVNHVFNAFSKTFFKLFADGFNDYFESAKLENITIGSDTFHHIFAGINENEQNLDYALLQSIVYSVCHQMVRVHQINLADLVLEDLMVIFGLNEDYLSASKLMESVLTDPLIDTQVVNEQIGLYRDLFAGVGFEIFEKILDDIENLSLLKVIFLEVMPLSTVSPGDALFLLFGVHDQNEELFHDLTGCIDPMIQKYFVRYCNDQDFKSAIKLLLDSNIKMNHTDSDSIYDSQYLKLFEGKDIAYFNQIYHFLYDLHNANYNGNRIEDLLLFTFSDIMCNIYKVPPNTDTHRILCKFIFDPRYYKNFDDSEKIPFAVQLAFDLNIFVNDESCYFGHFVTLLNGSDVDEFNNVLNFLYLHFDHINLPKKIDQMVIFLFDYIVPVNDFEPNMASFRILQNLCHLSRKFNSNALMIYFESVSYPQRTITFSDRIWRIMLRIKDVDTGKRSIGYQNYIEKIPVDKRILGVDPLTPNPTKLLTKRNWDHKMREWRLKLHKYDEY